MASPTEPSSITDAVERSVRELCKVFEHDPTLFYTENDIVCYFYHLLRESLPSQEAADKDGRKHSLIHREYPTPFRCDMANNRFEIKGDDERTPRGGKYQRGHFDIVLLNPDFIRQFPFAVIKAQNYELFKEAVVEGKDAAKPIALYGLEFMYSRDPLVLGIGDGQQIDRFVDKALQDANKLKASVGYHGFMGQAKTLVFCKGSDRRAIDLIVQRLGNRPDTLTCFGR